MANDPDTTPIHNVYAQRFAADLETNRKEQDQVSAQITELEERLKQLKADESWLHGMQGSLPPAADGAVASGGQVAPQPGQSPAHDTATVPPPRKARKATGRAAGRKAAQPRKTSGVASSAKAKTTAATAATAKKTTEAKTGKTAEPPLRELVLALLVSAAEPRMVSEVTTELAQAHPGRPASGQVVRNALEALARKNLIEKEHKQGSVMYSAPVQPAVGEQLSTAAPATDTTDEREAVVA
ncbi:hypothetical protein OG429_37405 [Streptomyces sp. NBC_00190]|uniref:hypothetical protein n=1 Tax=unclassified Streptomyces TaxID=2593676 RepID=UPI002E2DEC10|nr:hypothetical protein [Streptomyces sp. NBC_00190]WSZ44450.1 hypothetical protein OG239_39880 [Streptomyces sp. NBC_00868]